MDKNLFGKRLKKLRLDREISQTKLAQVLKTYQQSVARWEKGVILPGLETIAQLAIFFDVSADYLLGLENEL